MARDAEAAVALLEEKVKDRDAEAMWMLGVCCEFGMGTKQDVERAEQLYKCGAEHGNATAMLLTDELKNQNGRGCTQMDLRCGQERANLKQRFGNQIWWWWTGEKCGSEGANALASMLMMNVPLTTLNLSGKITTLLDMILNTMRHMIVLFSDWDR